MDQMLKELIATTTKPTIESLSNASKLFSTIATILDAAQREINKEIELHNSRESASTKPSKGRVVTAKNAEGETKTLFIPGYDEHSATATVPFKQRVPRDLSVIRKKGVKSVASITRDILKKIESHDEKYTLEILLKRVQGINPDANYKSVYNAHHAYLTKNKLEVFQVTENDVKFNKLTPKVR